MITSNWSSILSLLLGLYSVAQINAAPAKRNDQPSCVDFEESFNDKSIRKDGQPDHGQRFFSLGGNNTVLGGVNTETLNMYLRPPVPKENDEVRTENGTNNYEGIVATLNSTFVFHSKGQVTVEAAFPAVKGAVGVIRLVGTDYGPEIDMEITGTQSNLWKTDMFNTTFPEPQLYDTFDEALEFPDGRSATEKHSYSIYWDENKIVWGVDGESKRTLEKSAANKDGRTYWPETEMRLQFTLWDASMDKTTATWADGAIDWRTAPNPITMTVHKVKVECYNQ